MSHCNPEGGNPEDGDPQGCDPERCPGLEELAGMLALSCGTYNRPLHIHIGQARRYLDHWVDSCPGCRRRRDQLERWQEEVDHPDLIIVARERNLARQLWARLEPLSTTKLRLKIGRPYTFWAMCRLVMEKSREASTCLPRRGVELADIATGLTLLLSPQEYGASALAQLRARSFAYLGNAHRIAGNLGAAQKNLYLARRYLAMGRLLRHRSTENIQALVADFQGSLFKDLRQFDLARQELQRAAWLYRRNGLQALVGKVHLSLASIEELCDNLNGAMHHLMQAQELIDPDQDTFLFATSQHNLVGYLIRLGNWQEAELLLPRVRLLWQHLRHSHHLLFLRWLEGHLMLAKGELAEAEQTYREVSASFEALGVTYDSALVQLDLASLLASQDRWRESCSLALASCLALKWLGVSQEAMKALNFLRRMLATERISVAVIRSVADFLARLRNYPGQKFYPPATE